MFFPLAGVAGTAFAPGQKSINENNELAYKNGAKYCGPGVWGLHNP